ncbi:hypothetical protein SBRCBS47491_004644 [Sporothrix bragantina]|uniref:FAD/NAD(P)-binding domain-containing protein n=1 Tax=Sporothrix bragantina TaxID=671064 RepID=A0ABP0BQA2_9PEZI
MYMTYGRITIALGAAKDAFISPRWLTKIYVLIDIGCIVTQIMGSVLPASGNPSSIELSKKVLIGGLITQLVALSIFILNCWQTHHRIKRRPHYELPIDPSISWQNHFRVLELTTLLLIVRSIVRAIEFLQGTDGFVASHEAFIYVFDALPMFFIMVCKDFGVTKSLKIRHQVTGARWISDEQKWVTSTDLTSGISTSEKVAVLINAQGRINKPMVPKIPGFETFAGRVVHTAQWPSDLDVRGKRVAVVGNGASGQKILPNLLRQAHEYIDEEKSTFGTDGAAYREYRRELERGMTNKYYGWTFDEEAVIAFRKQLLDAPGYLEAFLRQDVDYLEKGIACVSPIGIKAVGSTEIREVDIIVLATGFQDGFYPRFPVIGPTATYLGVMAADTPNYFQVLQAQGNAFGGSVPLHCEVSTAYIARVLRKLHRDGYSSCSPTKKVAADFND